MYKRRKTVTQREKLSSRALREGSTWNRLTRTFVYSLDPSGGPQDDKPIRRTTLFRMTDRAISDTPAKFLQKNA